jgi:DNA-binding NarL/FixJ family response regulator
MKKNDSPKTSQQQLLQNQQRSVLLVDDEQSIRRAVGQLLSNHGYQVTTCPDGIAALHLLQQQQQQVDVIISDVRMPRMDGWQLLHQLRRNDNNLNLKQVPVILLTAQGLPQDRVRGYQAGADAYLPKPFDPQELLVLVDSVIQRRERLNGSRTQCSTSSSTDASSTTALVQDLKRSVQDIQRLLLEQPPGINHNNNARGVVHLAPPERQVLEWLCQGLRNKEIAERTYLSTRRVEQVLTTLYRRTKVKNRTELVRWAIATGTVKL